MEALSFVPAPPEVNNFRQGCDFGQLCHETLLFPLFYALFLLLPFQVSASLYHANRKLSDNQI